MRKNSAHLKDVGDGLVFIFYLKGLAIVASAVTDGAGDENVGEEVHFDFDDAVALAMFAAAPFDIEREATGLVATDLGLGERGKEVADRVKDAGIGSWV